MLPHRLEVLVLIVAFVQLQFVLGADLVGTIELVLGSLWTSNVVPLAELLLQVDFAAKLLVVLLCNARLPLITTDHIDLAVRVWQPA